MRTERNTKTEYIQRLNNLRKQAKRKMKTETNRETEKKKNINKD